MVGEGRDILAFVTDIAEIVVAEYRQGSKATVSFGIL